MGVKYKAGSGFRKLRFLSKLCFGGQVRNSEMPYVAHSRPLTILVRRTKQANLIFNYDNSRFGYNCFFMIAEISINKKQYKNENCSHRFVRTH